MAPKCPSCGAENPAEAVFCANCGTRLQTQPQSPGQGQSQNQGQGQSWTQTQGSVYLGQQGAASATAKERPTGVTILAALWVLNALASLLPAFFAGFLFLSVGAFAGVFGGLFVVLALIDLGIAWGLYSGKGWARLVAIVFAIIGLLAFPVGTVISIIILYYLTRPNVRSFFNPR
ncbi:MAG: zinc-ribbon domain-containing protein [Candidatus Marsarchaeota archaeon]|nr:zinc-ribbon domain-containing protein [Candidatus Marsarchaeota archaeon]